jgi:hypothetical protein
LVTSKFSKIFPFQYFDFEYFSMSDFLAFAPNCFLILFKLTHYFFIPRFNYYPSKVIKFLFNSVVFNNEYRDFFQLLLLLFLVRNKKPRLIILSEVVEIVSNKRMSFCYILMINEIDPFLPSDDQTPGPG